MASPWEPKKGSFRESFRGYTKDTHTKIRGKGISNFHDRFVIIRENSFFFFVMNVYISGSLYLLCELILWANFSHSLWQANHSRWAVFEKKKEKKEKKGKNTRLFTLLWMKMAASRYKLALTPSVEAYVTCIWTDLLPKTNIEKWKKLRGGLWTSLQTKCDRE